MEKEFEKWLSFNCSVRIYDGKGTPRGHNCHFSFGFFGDKPCFQILPTTGGKKTMKFLPANVVSMASQRVEEGHITVNFDGVNWNMVVISDAKDKASLQSLYEVLERMRAGENISGCDVTPTRNSLSSQRGVASSERSGKRRLPLSTSSRTQAPPPRRGLLMVAAAQNSSTTKQTGSFYRSCAPPPVEPFLPSQQQQPLKVVSPASSRQGGYYFKSASVRRNLSVDLGHPQQQQLLLPAAGDENDMDDFQQLKPYRQPLATPSRSPLANLLSQPPSTAFPYPSPAKTSDDVEGFANLGNTCYMNAVLQSLLGLEPFAEDLLHHQLVMAVHQNSLYRMMFLLLKSKRSKDTFESQRILLKKIKAAISARASKFLGYRQQDAHELLSQCLDQLKDDLGHISKSSNGSSPHGPLSPVVRNFECDIKHTITCKGCGKVTTNTEKIYDFALQLPKSVLLRPNEQANLQQLFDLYFSAEDVEYTCPLCSGNSATLSHQLARLPRVLVLFLKRYGYNSQLSKNSKRVDNIRIPRIINIKHLCVDSTEPPCEFRGPWPKNPAALSALATNSEDKENVPRTSCHPKSPNQTNPSLNNTSDDVIVSSSSTGSSGIMPLSISDESAPHRTDLLQSCLLSPIYPNPTPLTHSASAQNGALSHPSPLPTVSNSKCDLAQRDHNDHHFTPGGGCVQKLTQVDHSEHHVTQQDHGDHRKPAQGHGSISSSELPTSSILIYDQEAPVIEHSAKKITEGGCLLGKRKSSDRDSHSIDDGYCTCGSSCDSTPCGTTTATVLATPAAANCIYHSKVKRIESQASNKGSDVQNSSGDRLKEEGSLSTEKHDVLKADNASEKVNDILEEFDQIFESPEAVSALQQEERPRTRTATTVRPAGSEHQAELGHVSTTMELSQPPEARPIEALADSKVSSSTGEQKVPTIELEIGLEEIAKREDEELKKAMEESLRQQPNDFQLLERLGLSEEDQLKLALELSIQESLPEEALSAPPPSPSPSSLTPVTGTPTKENTDQNNRTVTPEPGNLEVYRLVSVVSHIGKGSSGGHYISDVYSIGDRTWKTYNDSQVVDTREEDVRQRRQCTGYIFFYMHRSTFNSVAKHHKH